MLPLFDQPPDGFRYQPAFLSDAEERALVEHIRGIAFADFEMRGQIARRRVAFFGQTYQRTGSDAAADPMPPFLLPVRARLAAWLGTEPDALAMALINEYARGAPIGWHRDAPQYAVIAGLSLLSACRMRFRPYVSPRVAAAPSSGHVRRRATYELTLAPRSAYLMTGAARSGYEHSIPPVDTLRYSITFRTLRHTPAGAEIR